MVHNDKKQRQSGIGFVLFLFALLLVNTSTLSAAGVDAKMALEKLMQGNQRYVTSTTVCHQDWSVKRAAVAKAQSPFAIIISCSDSRVPPELIFDQTLGALFVVRVAGNVLDDFAIGSIEYGVNILGANLVLVLGHSNCGAVDAALRGKSFDNHIQSVLTAIQPAVEATKGITTNRLEQTVKANVRHVEQTLKSSKPVLAELVNKGTLRILGGYYDLASGHVEFLDP